MSHESPERARNEGPDEVHHSLPRGQLSEDGWHRASQYLITKPPTFVMAELASKGNGFVHIQVEMKNYTQKCFLCQRSVFIGLAVTNRTLFFSTTFFTYSYIFIINIPEYMCDDYNFLL